LKKKIEEKKEKIGINGKFVVKYDVDRENKEGEVMVNDG
jgi:hypothetical protein